MRDVRALVERFPAPSKISFLLSDTTYHLREARIPVVCQVT
jgi:hypothetical protein